MSSSSLSNLSSIVLETEDGIPINFNVSVKNDKLVLSVSNLQITKANLKSEFFKKDYVPTTEVLKALHNGYLKELSMFNSCEECKESSIRSKYCSILDKIL